jgi:hypothetical protein
MFKNVIKKPTLYRSYIWDGTTETFDMLVKDFPHYDAIMNDEKRIETTFVHINKVSGGIEAPECKCIISLNDAVLKNLETGEAIVMPQEMYVRDYVEVASQQPDAEKTETETETSTTK